MSVILCCPAIMSPTTPSPPFIPPFLPSFFAYSPINRPETCRIGEIQSNGDHRQLQRNWLLHSWFEGPPPVGFAAQHMSHAISWQILGSVQLIIISLPLYLRLCSLDIWRHCLRINNSYRKEHSWLIIHNTYVFVTHYVIQCCSVGLGLQYVPFVPRLWGGWKALSLKLGGTALSLYSLPGLSQSTPTKEHVRMHCTGCHLATQGESHWTCMHVQP